ncbi:MAG: thiosulfate oxidation carrier protein SoxY [Campylobacterales bacterium]|nr:thiosulfate oxidation carrier protein SoxY [Campylobacterales bacterium]
MERRKFIGLGMAGVAALALAPSTLSAIDFRATKPNAWTVTNPFVKGTKGDLKGGPTDHSAIKAAIKEIFGSDSLIMEGVDLKTPDIAENGAVVPVSVEADKGSKVAILNNANPEALVAVFTVPAKGKVDFAVRIKMQQTGDIVAVVEKDGKLYAASKSTKVTAGGCGG